MNSTCRLDVTIPPMLGAAIGFMISMPAPVANITGSSDRTIAATVISFGRRRVADPSMTASTYDCPACAVIERAANEDDHDDAGLHGDGKQ